MKENQILFQIFERNLRQGDLTSAEKALEMINDKELKNEGLGQLITNHLSCASGFKKALNLYELLPPERKEPLHEKILATAVDLVSSELYLTACRLSKQKIEAEKLLKIAHSAIGLEKVDEVLRVIHLLENNDGFEGNYRIEGTGQEKGLSNIGLVMIDTLIARGRKTQAFAFIKNLEETYLLSEEPEDWSEIKTRLDIIAEEYLKLENFPEYLEVGGYLGISPEKAESLIKSYLWSPRFSEVVDKVFALARRRPTALEADKLFQVCKDNCLALAEKFSDLLDEPKRSEILEKFLELAKNQGDLENAGKIAQLLNRPLTEAELIEILDKHFD